MRTIQKMLSASAVVALFAANGFAQTAGGGGNQSLGSSAQTLGGGQGGNQNGGTTTSVTEAPTIESTTGGFSQSVVKTSNGIGPYYANPLYAGRVGQSSTTLTTVSSPGGFGAATYSSSATAAQGGGGRATGGTTTGAAGGRAGGGTTGNGTGLLGTANTTGILSGTTTGTAQRQAGQGGTTTGSTQNNGLTTGRQISYTQTIKFAAPAIPTDVLQSELQTLMAGSSSLPNGRSIEAVVSAPGVVSLKGRVGDEDEARLAEGMIRLTPGVREVKNDLTFPKP